MAKLFFFFAILSPIAKFCQANTETSSDQASRSSNEVFLEVHFCNLPLFFSLQINNLAQFRLRGKQSNDGISNY